MTRVLLQGNSPFRTAPSMRGIGRTTRYTAEVRRERGRERGVDPQPVERTARSGVRAWARAQHCSCVCTHARIHAHKHGNTREHVHTQVQMHTLTRPCGHTLLYIYSFITHFHHSTLSPVSKNGMTVCNTPPHIFCLLTRSPTTFTHTHLGGARWR